MLKALFLGFLLLSLIFFSGCVNNQTISKENTTTRGNTTNLTTEELENQAIAEIEKEMNHAIENMSTEDIENLITK